MCPPDEIEAVKWYRKAAEQGHGDAQNELAKCYLYGKGVAQNLEEAKKWNSKAIEKKAAKSSYEDIYELPPVKTVKP